MDYLVFFIIIFTLVFIIYFLRVNLRRLRKKNYQKMMEINYLINRFKLDKENVDYKSLGNIVALANALIISIVSVAVMMIPLSYIWQMIIGFIMAIIMIILVYGLIGKYLLSKGSVENDRSKKSRKKVAKKVGRK